MNHRVNIVVALKAEAKPLIETFDLVQVSSLDGISMYANDDVLLAVSGVGKEAVTKTIDAITDNCRDVVNAWLNIGIAGHGCFEVGEGFLVRKIQDEASGEVWYPMVVFDYFGKSGTIKTVSQPEQRYEDDVGYDMEASGFMTAALFYSTAELVHCYKVVSDNSKQSMDLLNKKSVKTLIAAHSSSICKLTNELASLAAQVAKRRLKISSYSTFVERWRFSQTQRHMLNKILRKYSVLGFDIDLNSDALARCSDATSVLNLLSKHLEDNWYSRNKDYVQVDLR